MSLDARGLGCDYGPVRALRDVTLSAARGSVTAVFGPNGAGKTTLLKALSGERRPDRGEVSLDGRAVSGADPEWRGKVGAASHRTGLYQGLAVRENLAFFAALHGLGRGAAAAAGTRMLEELGASRLADRMPRTLSRGERQRVALARSLLHDPEVLLLDEPFTGMDRTAAAALEAALLARRDAGAVVVLATHDLRRGLRLADRAVVLRGGRKALDEDASACRAGDVMDAMGGTGAVAAGAGGIGAAGPRAAAARRAPA